MRVKETMKGNKMTKEDILNHCQEMAEREFNIVAGNDPFTNEEKEKLIESIKNNKIKTFYPELLERNKND